MRVAPVIELTDEERKTLTKYSRGRNTPAKVVLRAKLILRAAEGLQNKVIAAELETDPQFVGRWRTRIVEGRLKAIEKDAPRSGRKASQKVVKRILDATTQEKPAGATHWSVRTLAQHLSVIACVDIGSTVMPLPVASNAAIDAKRPCGRSYEGPAISHRCYAP